MADDVTIKDANDADVVVATDDVGGGREAQIVKIADGTNGSATLITPLTDEALRATPVPVALSGTTPVSGPLTDAQLRATNVGVVEANSAAALSALGAIAATILTGELKVVDNDSNTALAALAALISGGRLLTADGNTAGIKTSVDALATTVSGGRLLTSDSAQIRTAVEALAAIISGGRILTSAAQSGTWTEANSAAIKTAIEALSTIVVTSRLNTRDENTAAIKTATEALAAIISGGKLLTTETSAAGIKTSVDALAAIISGGRLLTTEASAAGIKTSVDALAALISGGKLLVDTEFVGGAGAVAATVLRVTLASDDPAVASLSVIDDWDESDRAKVNLIVGSTGVDGNSGNKSAATQRVVLATDQPALTTPMPVSPIGNINKHVSDGSTLVANTLKTAALTVSGFTATEMQISNVDGAAAVYYTLDGSTPAGTAIATADMVTNGTTTITSATAAFLSARDQGRPVSGTNIPAGTTIASVTNATTAVLSQSATGSGSGGTLTMPVNFAGVLPATPSNEVLPCNATPTLKLISAGTPIWRAAVRGA